MGIRVRIFGLLVLLHLVGCQFVLQTQQHVDQGASNDAISEDGKVSLAPQDGNCIGRLDRTFWNTVRWYFANVNRVIVSGIYGDELRGELNSTINHFNKFFHSVPTPTLAFRFYKRRGFKVIPNSKIAGVLVVAEKLDILLTFFSHTPTDLVESSKSNFLFIILEQTQRNATEAFVSSLWRRHNIYNLMVMLPCAGGMQESEDLSQMVGFLNPFVAQGDLWGKVKWSPVDNLNYHLDEDSDLWQGDGNFRGYPIKCLIFMKYPSMLLEKEIPRFFAQSYIQKNAKTPNNLGGLDALVLAALASKLNFSIVLNITRMDYGYVKDNGSVFGSLGDVYNKYTDISFNNRFVMKYPGISVEFLYPIISDHFCLFAPKAEQKPKWLAIFKCFDINVWFILVISSFTCGYVRYVIKRWERQITFSMERKYSLGKILLETFNVMMSSPSILLPKNSSERLFLGICLLVNVIITGTFQGTLVTSITTPASYKEIDTLQELDDTGLLIYTPSEQLFDIFGDGGTKVLDSLKSKMRMTSKAQFDILMLNKTSAFTSRKLDSTLIIQKEYTKPDGTAAYHIVKECPRNYHMSYIIRSGWAFSNLFNSVLIRLREAGFTDMWYKSTETAILMHRKIAVDRPVNTLKPFNLEDMQTAFLILALGLTTCTFVFALELTWKYLPQLMAH